MRAYSEKSFVFLLPLVLAAGCYHPDRHTESASFDEAIQSVTVDVGSGDVTLRGRDVAGATVTARIDGDSNHLGHSVEDGHLVLFDDCHDDQCGVDITATVPAGAPVELHTGSGDITVEDLLGTLALHTGSGDIEGWGLAGTDLVATTGSGDVELDARATAERIHVRTGSGDVRLDVPSGSYALRVDTGSGDTSVRGVSDDGAAPATLEVTTGSGDVVIRGH